MRPFEARSPGLVPGGNPGLTDAPDRGKGKSPRVSGLGNPVAAQPAAAAGCGSDAVQNR